MAVGHALPSRKPSCKSSDYRFLPRFDESYARLFIRRIGLKAWKAAKSLAGSLIRRGDPELPISESREEREGLLRFIVYVKLVPLDLSRLTISPSWCLRLSERMFRRLHQNVAEKKDPDKSDTCQYESRRRNFNFSLLCYARLFCLYTRSFKFEILYLNKFHNLRKCGTFMLINGNWFISMQTL